EILQPEMNPTEAAARVITIPDPVEIYAEPASADEVDPDLLVSLRSPHRGFEETLEAFTAVRRRFPSMRLALMDSGDGCGPRRELPEGVDLLDPVPPAEFHERLRRALGLFHPQTGFAETSRLGFAEANALGVPVLAH